MKIDWNKIGLVVSILILVAMLIVWILFVSFGYSFFFSEVLQVRVTDLEKLIAKNAIIILLLYLLPILLILKNIEMLIDIFKTQKEITRNNVHSLLYIVLPLYTLLCLYPLLIK